MADLAQEMNDVPIEPLHEVRACFRDVDAMDRAVAALEMSGFDRADLSLPEPMPSAAENTPEAGAKPVDTEEDARQARTLHTSAAASLAGMAAAGVVIATGGAAAPAVAAAAAGAGLAGGLAYGMSSAVNRDEQIDRDQRASAGELILSVHASSAEKREQAKAILREAGGTELAASKDASEDQHDEAVAESFPASDPPASSGIVGPRLRRPINPGPAPDQQ
jgi:outer membrane lipoprotein SlyB